MRTLLKGRKPVARALSLVAFALVATGCGSSSSTSKTTNTAVPSPNATSTITTARPTAAPRPHLRIISPRPGARTGQTVAVHVVVAGAKRPGPFRYVLDGGRPILGTGRFTFMRLRAGRHHIVVIFAGEPTVRVIRIFVVRPPPAPASPAPVQSAAPAPTPPAPAPAPPAAPAPATTPAPPPTSTGSIPQGPSAGDRDGDNNGGPSDGDGNI